ncbi:class C sortase [Corynebacterium sp.]|uniref:class C sortase n=1 Tax=Corynebacterium sp. TaxID=1720 RepID=UPI0026E04B45|nr:class C sortase [Corynebacterium sp.]MDO5512035.1 class C sortase [Corynebacterium sp.]
MGIHSAVATLPPQRRRRSSILPVVVILVGVLLLLYPVVATQWNNIRQQEAALAYSKLEQKAEPSALAAAIDAARTYNRTRTPGPILDPWLSRVTEENTDYQAYLAELHQLETMARLIVPSATVDLPVFHGTSEEVLTQGVGHLYGSDLPVGGEGSHAVLTAHTGLTTATLFDNLVDVRVGDPIYVQVSGEKLKYEVHDTQVVLPEDTDSLAQAEGEDLLTLITCTPYGVNTHRLLVHAHRVPMDDNAGFLEKPAITWQWWMWAMLAGAVVVFLALVAWLRHQYRRASREH